MKNFTFIRETSILRLSYWKQLFFTALFIMTTLLASFTLTAQNLPGTVPVLTPTGGFGIDGDAYANAPTTGIGDWFYNSLYPGSGGSLFNANGTVIDPTMTFFLQDVWGIKDPTIFIGSNKINDDPTDPQTPYEWGEGNVPAKNEIQNVGAHFAYGDVGLGGDADDLWCIFAADRQVVNGDAYIDFEFLQKSLIMEGITSGKFVSEGTDGGRTLGDILVTLIFTNGGTSAEVQIRVWEAVNGGYEYILHPNSEYVGSIFVTNNNSITNVPFDVYGVTPGVYEPNQWVEGAVNLSTLLNIGENPCATVATLFVRTKTSQAVQAELSDFPIGPIQLNLGLAELTVNCPSNVTIPACSTQEQVNTAFEAWKAGFSYDGGVPTIVESYAYTGGADIGSNLTSLSPPDICGATISITYTATDFCEQTDSCTATFTVTDAPEITIVQAPQNASVSACDYEVGDFAAWIALQESNLGLAGGCDPQLSNDAGEQMPDACGDEITVTWTIIDTCLDPAITASATFTVTEAPEITIVQAPQNASVSACDYEVGDFAAWIALQESNLGLAGGCDPQLSNDAGEQMPDACGDEITVTWTITDTCLDPAITASATFTVTEAPEITIVQAPQNASVSACDYEVGDFAAWIALQESNLGLAGGCDPQLSNDAGEQMPDACGDEITVTWTIIDTCLDPAITASATFTVTEAPEITIVQAPQNASVSACDYEVGDFAAWIALQESNLGLAGGCDPQLSNDAGEQMPDACGDEITVTWTITDTCLDPAITASATFTVTAPDPLVISDVQDTLIPGCYYGTQGDLDTAFALWLEGFTVSGGCDPQGVFAETYIAPDRALGGFVDVLFNVTDLCENGSDRARFTVEPCQDQFCSYTQGYYGNPNGTSCDGENTFTTYGLIEKALDYYPGDVMRIGMVNHSILISKTMADINKVIEYLPGGKASYELSAGNISISDIVFRNWYTTTVGKNNTTINNTLLAQTITLGLNLGMYNDLGAFAMQEGTFATADLDGGCGSTIAKERYCDTDTGMVYNEYEYYTIMANIAAAASDVNELFGLANAALGNADGIVGTEQGISLANIAKAVDDINNAFDGCRMFMGYGVEPLECVIVPTTIIVPEEKAMVVEEPAVIDSSVDFKVYPVPFEDVINVQYRFEYDTDVTIQVFNLQGGLIYGAVDTMYNNGEVATKQINLARTFDQALIVRLTTNKEKLNKNIVAKSIERR